MTEAELIRQVQHMAQDLSQRNCDWQRFFRNNTPKNVQVMLEHEEIPDLPPPATLVAVRAAEEAVGFRFPTLLGRLWTKVANGGFGPGGGIFGVEGGWEEERVGLTIAPFYLDAKLHNGFGLPWPDKLVPICYWGGDDYSAIDCTTTEGDVVDLLESECWRPKRKKLTFTQWVEAWVNGVEL